MILTHLTSTMASQSAKMALQTKDNNAGDMTHEIHINVLGLAGIIVNEENFSDVGGGRVRKSSTVRELLVRLSIIIQVHIAETVEHLKLLIQNGRRGERKASLLGNTKTQ